MKNKSSATAKLSIIFISLAIFYFVIILGFNSFYTRLFVHIDERNGLDHRTSRNMFHQFSKENYFHGGSSNSNSITDQQQQQRLVGNDKINSNDHAFVKEVRVDKNKISISENENMKNELLASTSTITSDHASTKSSKKQLQTADKKEESNNKEVSRLGSLSCNAHSGPDDEFARKEMVYWSDIPEDEEFVSPYKKHDKERYLTFEPDGGGWNNIRMAMETVVAMAHAMGRTLVVPPSQNIYLLNKGRQQNFFSFADFFHLEDIASEHSGMNIISMEEFLKRTAMNGLLVNSTTGSVSFPPGNRTDWNGRKLHEKELWEYLREVTDVRNWHPTSCIFAFPSTPGKESTTAAHEVTELQKVLHNLKKSKHDKPTKPVPVDAPSKERLAEMASSRNELCVYDSKMQESLVVHFMCYYVQRARLLTHYYTFLFFENYIHDLWTKRFVRDHLRYVDSLQCAAARVVLAIREKARQLDPINNPEGMFDTFHVRRGDFQYKSTRASAEDLLLSCKNEIPKGTTVYVATDERKKDFFKPLAEYYNLLYLDDFTDLLTDVNTNNYGMLDQLLASKGRTFFGTYYSTFTGYIHRMRGYHVEKNKEKGYEDGLLLNSYFFLPEHKDLMRKYYPPRASFMREYAVSWRDIDRGIHDM